MIKIKDGYDGQECRITINRARDRMAELWITQVGLHELTTGLKLKLQMGKKVDPIVLEAFGPSETMSYMTLDELLDLRNMCSSVIREIIGDFSEHD